MTSRPIPDKLGILCRSLVICLPLLAAGCDTVGDFFEDDPPPPLPGERLSVLQLEQQLEPDPELASADITVGTPFRNSDWPQAGGYPDHNMGHLALDLEGLERDWSLDIGSGSSGGRRLVAQPVAANGRIYALDAEATLTAISIDDGDRIWSIETRLDDEDEDVLSGGVAVAEGKVFVTTGYATLAAFDADSGTELWRQRMSAPSRAAPTVSRGFVYVVTVDNKLIALDAATGTVVWDHSGLVEAAGLLGTASPATDGEVLVVGYSSGELHGLRPENGASVWQDSLAAIRRLGMMASMADIRALPVISDGTVIALSHANRLLALNVRSGIRVWQRTIGGTTTPVIAGDFVLLISNDNELMALRRSDGRIRWVTQLPRFEDEEDREDPIIWTSPLLAGGKVLIAGSDGEMLVLEPSDGALVDTIDLPGDVLIDPLVVDNTLLVLDEGGTLSAFR
ncbi:MAG: PQQ-binding-like beta-propeller repeat protein [Alphaproteobacteria bacterium]|nr:PQQ-binding-like beta-propeller repeat protein [Alphaproteobacteria bacterium SS10]